MTTDATALVDTYLDAVSHGDVDTIVMMYAHDATLEDPVGSDAVHGRDAIRRFYERALRRASLHCERTGPVCSTGAALAFPFRLTVADGAMVLDVIDVFELDASGAIRSMRAYWGAP